MRMGMGRGEKRRGSERQRRGSERQREGLRGGGEVVEGEDKHRELKEGQTTRNPHSSCNDGSCSPSSGRSVMLLSLNLLYNQKIEYQSCDKLVGLGPMDGTAM